MLQGSIFFLMRDVKKAGICVVSYLSGHKTDSSRGAVEDKNQKSNQSVGAIPRPLGLTRRLSQPQYLSRADFLTALHHKNRLTIVITGLNDPAVHFNRTGLNQFALGEGFS